MPHCWKPNSLAQLLIFEASSVRAVLDKSDMDSYLPFKGKIPHNVMNIKCNKKVG